MCNFNNCQLCRSLVISTAVAVTTVDGVDTLTINIPAGVYANGQRVCLVIAQNIPDAATVNMPVAITIGTGTATYPIVNCNCAQVTARNIRSRRRYPLRVATNATSAVFKSLEGLECSVADVLETIPPAADAGG